MSFFDHPPLVNTFNQQTDVTKTIVVCFLLDLFLRSFHIKQLWYKVNLVPGKFIVLKLVLLLFSSNQYSVILNAMSQYCLVKVSEIVVCMQTSIKLSTVVSTLDGCGQPCRGMLKVNKKTDQQDPGLECWVILIWKLLPPFQVGYGSLC